MTARSKTLVLAVAIALLALALGTVAYAQDETPAEPAPVEAAPAEAPGSTDGYGATGPAARPQPAQVIMLATMTPAGEAAFPGDDVMAADIGNLLRDHLMAIKGMSIATLHPNSPMIKNSPNLSPDDVAAVEGEEPATRAQRAQNIVKELRVDYALVPAITEYRFDATKPQARVTLTVFRVPAEGQPTLIVVAGRSPERPPRNASEALLARAAAADAALRAAAQILDVSVEDLQKWTRLKRGGTRHRRFLFF
jgi:hypothetical protein